MKKKILALAIVLVMIISMLPVTAFALDGDPSSSAKVRVYKESGYTDIGMASGEYSYVAFEDVIDETTGEVLGNRPYEVTYAERPESNYIAINYSDAGVLTLTFNNVYHKRHASTTNPFISIYKNTSTGATNNFDVVYNFVGVNHLEGPNVILCSENIGEVTVTGTGSMEMRFSQTYKKAGIWGSQCSKMTIKDTTLTMVQDGTSSARYGIVSAGDILVENSVVSITSDYGYCLATRSGSTTNASTATLNSANITIKNSTLTALVTNNASSCAIQTYGTITLDNSNVYLSHSDTNSATGTKSYSVLMKAPTIVGEYSVKQAAQNGHRSSSVSYKDYDEFGVQPGDQLKRGSTAGTLIRSIKLEHKHTTSDCTVESTCTCQKVLPAGEHTPGEAVLDETTNEMVTSCVVCGSVISRLPAGEAPCTHENAPAQEFCDVAVICPDCEEVVHAVKAHTPGEDDGDCTTAVACSVCGKEAVAAAEAHVPAKELDNCLKGVKCANCDQYAIEPVSSHTGTQPDRPCGTHHKCEICGQSWGAKKAHEEVAVLAQEATCGVAGHLDYWTCENCDKVFAAADCSVEIEDLAAWLAEGGDGYIAPTGEHTEGEPAVDPETGDTVISCTVCNKEISRVPAEEPECEHVAGEAYYTYGSDNGLHIKIVDCAMCGENMSREEEECSGGTATCTDPASCQYCELSYGESLGHTAGAAADCENDQTCTVCGEVLVEKLGHTAGAAADCENDQICTVCKKVLVEKLGHTEQTVEGKAATCTEDGLTDGIVCSVCGETIKAQETIKAEGHKYEATVTAPTFEAKGYTTHTCSVCGDSYVDSYVDALIAVATADGVKFETLQAAVNAGGTVELLANIETDVAILVNKTVVLNLNGFNVKTTEKDTAGDGVFHVVAGGDLTINGEGIIDGVGGNDWNIAIFADGGKVTINGGTYTNVGATDGGANTQFDLIYTKNGGTVTVNGGKFIAQTPAWTLNENDKNRGTIKVYGGEFFAFDPANNKAEGEGTNFLADTSKHTAVDAEGYYAICTGTGKAPAKENEVKPDCTNLGSYDLVTYCDTCDKVLEKVTVPVEATGHTPGTEADCENDQTCTVCGEVLVEKLGHNPGEEATCTTAQTCTKCGTELAPAKGHRYSELQVFTFCEEEGYITVACGNCGGKWDSRTDKEAQDYLASDVGQFINIKPQGHKYDSVTTDATCTEDGKTVYTCACGDTYEEVIPAGHKLEVVLELAATCNRGGYTKSTCTACGETFITDETEAQGHNLEVVTVVAPTCNRGGYTQNKCTRCGGTFYTDETEAQGHNLEVVSVVEATCNRGGYTTEKCTRCGGTFKTNETEANGHSFTEKVKALSYRKSAATADSNAIFYYACSVCGESSEGHTNTTWEYVNTAQSSKSVARIDDKYYNSLDAAIDAAVEGNTIVLLKDVKEGEAIVITKNITINLDNHVYTVISPDTGAAVVVGDKVEATLSNGTIQIRYTARTEFNCLVNNMGTVNASNITLKATNAHAEDAVAIKGNAIEGATVIKPTK